MKSAYELAMERLAKSEPDAARPLSAAQKARLAGIDTVFKGRIAEREVFLRGKIEQALAEGDLDAVEKLRAEMQQERARLEEEREEEKERVRRAKR